MDTRNIGVGMDTRNGEFWEKVGNDEFLHAFLESFSAKSGLGNDGGLDSMESRRELDLLNGKLSCLVGLKPGDFWKEVSETSLHAFLESFLKYCRRGKGIVTGGIAGSELGRNVFRVLHRISSHRDPDAEGVDSLKDCAALLEEKKLLDLPMLWDICALYGYGNEDMMRSLVEKAIETQPRLLDNFTAISSEFMNNVRTMYQRCTSSLEVTANLQDQAISQPRLQDLEVMNVIYDTVENLDAFVAVYHHAAVLLCCPVEMSHGDEKLLVTLAKLHDVLLPSLQSRFQSVLASRGGESQEMSGDWVSEVLTSIKLLSPRIIKFGWNLLNICYLVDKGFRTGFPHPMSMKKFPANMKDPMERTKILVQTLKEINQQYAENGVGDLRGSFLQNIEKHHQLFTRVEFLQGTGWFLIDDGQKQLISDILIDPFSGIQVEMDTGNGEFWEKVCSDEFRGLDLSLFDSGQKKSSLWQTLRSMWLRREGKKRIRAAISPVFQPPTPEPFPWFFISHGKSKTGRKTSFYSICSDTSYLTSAPELMIKGKRVICCFDDWVVIQDTRVLGALSVIIQNMRSSTTIRPSLYQLHQDDTYSLDPYCVMTASPNTGHSWTLLFFSTLKHDVLIWSEGSWFEQGYGCSTMYGTVLYGVCAGRETVYGFSGCFLGVLATVSGKLTVTRLVSRPEILRRELRDDFRVSYFLVGSRDELFVVRVVDTPSSYTIRSVAVYRLTEEEDAWVKVDNLGDYDFFINAALPSNSFVCSNSTKGNRIFFANFYRRDLLYIYLVEVENLMISLPCDGAVNSRSFGCFIMPQQQV